MLHAETMVMVEPTGKTVKRVSPSGDETPSLPNELVYEILLRVPVRSLLQFRCVCKSWKTLISHPQFAKDHFRTSVANHNMANLQLFSPIIGGHKIVSNSLQSLVEQPSLPRRLCFAMNERYRILGSCNGLLCLIDSLRTYVTLWNPSTRIPSRRFHTGIDICSAFILHHGFGYDHVNETFKLLIAVEGFRGHQTVTKIFTFSTNSWKVIQNFPYRLRSHGNFVSCNNTLNWIAKRDVGDVDQWVIFSFDLVTEKYGEVFLPDGEFDDVYFSVVDALGQRECLCISFLNSKKSHWVVWLMKEYGVHSSWTNLVTIPCFVEGDHNWNRWSYRLKPLYISETGVLILETQVYKVVLYNLNDGKLAYPTISNETRFHSMYICHESLILPPC